jgi:hypothetical protein
MEVELPSGEVVEFPDGTPNHVMEAALRDYHARTWKPRNYSAASVKQNAALHRGFHPVTEEMGAGATFAAGAGKAIMDTGRGIGQILGMRSTQDVDESRQTDDALLNTGAGIGGNFVGGAAQAVVPVGNVAGRLGMVGKAAPIVNGAVQGGSFASLQPVGTGESRLANTALGAGLGGAGAAAAPAFQAVGKSASEAISPQVRAMYEAAKARGIQLTPAQLSDSRFMKFFESQLRSLPGSGAAAKAAQQRAAFNARVAETIGEKAPAVNDEVYAAAKARHSRQFADLTSRNDLKVTPQVVSRLEAAIQQAEVAGPEVAQVVRAAVHNFYEQAVTGKAGVIVPGAAYQAMDSALGQVTRLGTPVSHFVGQVKHALREAMDASINPADRAAWRQLRQEYGNRKTIRDLVGKSSTGDISPQALMGRVTANNAGKEAMASGTRGELGTLARIGQVMKEPPNSGTADRQLANSILLPWNALAQLGRVAMGATAGRAAGSNTLAALMMRESRGKPIQGLARLLEKSQLPKTLPAAGMTAAQAAAAEEREKKKKR